MAKKVKIQIKLQLPAGKATRRRRLEPRLVPTG